MMVLMTGVVHRLNRGVDGRPGLSGPTQREGTTMRYITAALAAFALLMVGIATATAAHNPPVLDIGPPGECGVITFTLSQPDGTHVTPNARVVVEADGQVQVGNTELPVTVGPFESEDEFVEISFRVFGGGERDYDMPLWNGYGEASFKDDVNAYGAEHGWDWTVAGVGDGNPFVAWDTVSTMPCPPDEEDPATEDEDGEQGGEDATEVGAEDETSNEDEDPVAVPTTIPAGAELPHTGANPLLLGVVAFGLLAFGAWLVVWRRSRSTM